LILELFYLHCLVMHPIALRNRVALDFEMGLANAFELRTVLPEIDLGRGGVRKIFMIPY